MSEKKLNFKNKNILKISIITVCYNAVHEIEKTISSVINQTYDNIEYIIIDGGSTDGTIDIIKKYTSKIAYWISETDNGIYDAMNKGLHVATGFWVNFMNAGDRYYCNESLSMFISQINQDSIIAYGNDLIELEDCKFQRVSKELDLRLMYNHSIMPHQSTLIKLSYHKKHLYNTFFISSADYMFFYQAYFNDICKFQYIPIVVSIMDGERGMSKSRKTLHIRREQVLYEKKYKGQPASKIKNYIILIFEELKFFTKDHLPRKVKFYIRRKLLEKRGYKIEYY